MSKLELPHYRTRARAATQYLLKHVVECSGSGMACCNIGTGEIAGELLKDNAALIEECARLQHIAEQQNALIRDLSLNATEPRGGARQVGRTTRLILRSMLAASEGHDVLVIGLSMKHATALRDKIRQRCQSWHIPIESGACEGPRITAHVPNDDRDGFHGVVLVDHAAVEAMEATVS